MNGLGMKKKSLKILFFTPDPFPAGHAMTNRILSYCYGLIQHDVKVHVVSTASKKFKWTTEDNEWVNSVRWKSFAMPDILQCKATRFLHKYLVYILSLIVFVFSMIRNRFDAVVFNGSDTSLNFLIVRLAKSFGSLVLREVNEYPLLKYDSIDKGEEYTNRFIKDNYGYFDYLLVMTNQLHVFMSEHGIPDSNMLLIPNTTIIGRYSSREFNQNVSFEKYIAFTGSLSNQKDGVLYLIEAFERVVNNKVDINLVIAGFGSTQEINAVKELLRNKTIASKVIFLQNVPSCDIPSIINNAKLLVLSRPYSLQAKYGFPTKLVEYLATGNPVLTTAHGDMKMFLKDKENAFLLESAAPEHISEKIIEILSNYQQAMKVGIEGQRLVDTSFNPIINVRPIVDVLRHRNEEETM